MAYKPESEERLPDIIVPELEGGTLRLGVSVDCAAQLSANPPSGGLFRPRATLL